MGEFEWDSEGGAKSQEARRFVCRGARRVRRSAARIFDDPDHSVDERREIIVGYSMRPRLLVVGFTEREDRVRILNAVARRGPRQDVMKRTRKARTPGGDLRTEYEFDYAKGRRNRFASASGSSTVAVVLDPDVARVFGSSVDVNRLLRSVIKAVPGAAGVDRKRKAG